MFEVVFLLPRLACVFSRFVCLCAAVSPRTVLVDSAGVAASLVSQPSDTILVEVNDKAEGDVNIVETVRV